MIEIGKAIKQLRIRYGYSIREVAQKCGRSISHVSKIERGLVTPSLEALERIAQAFNVPVTTFFSNSNPASPITRRSEMAHITLPSCIVVSLTNNTENQSFGVYFHLEVDGICESSKGRASHKVNFFMHDGEEFIHVLEGAMKFTLGSEEYLMDTGDSVYFDARIPHSGTRTTAMLKLLIITNPATAIPGINGQK